jgi:repressor LexA
MTTSRRPPGGGRDRLLTSRRQQILDYIRESMERRGFPPSMREIADAVGLKSASTVSYHFKILKEAGYLDRDPRLPRTVVPRPSHLRVLRAESDEVGEAAAGSGSQNMVSVPLFDRIAAGTPVIANGEPEEILPLPRALVGYGDVIAINVTGDSMINAGIFDGDIAFVRCQDAARNGDIVAARSGDEVTVKTLRVMNDRVWLLPQNPTYEPIPGDSYRIMGKVVGTYRRF